MVNQNNKRYMIILALSLVLLASWILGNMIYILPEVTRTGEQDNFFDNSLDQDEYEEEERGGFFQLVFNMVLAMILGILAGSIMSLLVVKRSAILGQIATLAFLAIVLIVIFYVNFDIGDPLQGVGFSNPFENIDFGVVFGEGVAIGIITFFLIILFVLVALFVNRITSSTKEEYLFEPGMVEYQEVEKEDKELIEGISETVEKAVRSLDRGGDIRGVIIGVYKEMCDLLEKGGISNQDSMTPREFQTLALRKLDVSEELISDLTSLFEEARYSSHTLTEDKRELALRDLNNLKEEIGR